MIKKTVAVFLCALLTGLCAGVEPWQAAAAEIGRVSVGAAGSGLAPVAAPQAVGVSDISSDFHLLEIKNSGDSITKVPIQDMKILSLPQPVAEAPERAPKPAAISAEARVASGVQASGTSRPAKDDGAAVQKSRIAFDRAAAKISKALLGLAFYGYGLWRGRAVTDLDFENYKRSEVFAGRMDAGVAELMRVHRGTGASSAQGGTIHLRPELVATPWLFRRVLNRTLGDWRADSARGPPAGFVVENRVPTLQRVLRAAHVSLALARPYDMLVLNADSPEFKDPAVYRAISGQKDLNVEVRESDDPQKVLDAPHTTPVGRIDEVAAARNLNLRYRAKQDAIPVPSHS